MYIAKCNLHKTLGKVGQTCLNSLLLESVIQAVMKPNYKTLS